MSHAEPFSSLEEEVSDAFVRRMHGNWTPADQTALEKRLASDPAYAQAYRLAEESSRLLISHAEMPEMMRFRERAIAHARHSSANRWFGPMSNRIRWHLAASFVGAVVVLAVAWQLSPWGFSPGQYRTGIGEQRMVELDDHSRIALDAATRIAVRYTNESRTIELIEGQAQFSVAKDPARPFKVQVGDHTIVALGTVFAVEFTDQQIRVAMVEGRVSVVPRSSSPNRRLPPPIDGEGLRVRRASPDDSSRVIHLQRPQREAGVQRSGEAIELSAGEELKVSQDGHATLTLEADLEAAMAWRSGRVVFRTEKLVDAIGRMNRYSRVQLEVVDPVLADETVSGVFEAGDTQGFIAGLQLALPVVASYRDANTVRLSLSQ